MNVIAPVYKCNLNCSKILVDFENMSIFLNDPCKKLLSTNDHSHLYSKINFTASLEH